MMAANPKCPLCQSVKSRNMAVLTAILNLPGNSPSSVFRCKGCNVYYLSPYISDHLISELYSKSYFAGQSQDYTDLHVSASSNDYEREIAAARLGKFRETLVTLLKHCPNASSILDIGAATGEFLAIAREYDLSVSGIELSSHAAARAKEKFGLDFHEISIVDYTGTETYDLIHMNHVFEHFRTPHQVLERIASLLRKGGVVYVEVPFQFNVFEVIKYRTTGKRKDFDVFSLHHPIFYRPNSLKKIFDDHGFNCRSMKVFDWQQPAQSEKWQ